ncbi:MAG: hypothetical protein PHP08_00355 [Candidatus Dojkabacteria bacterium]|nr:hypothetical protein [Candidatus Dojkabacteria bacterium]
MDKNWIIAGFIGLGAILLMNKSASQIPQSSKYTYTLSVNSLICKHWQFIESRSYMLVLNDGESINLNITFNLPIDKTIDIVDIRFHNVCSTSEGYGKIYAYVNNQSALPTIGIVNNEIPIYVGFPSCPNYGTVFTTVWDTDDVKGNGVYNYTYVYKGSTPLYIKSLELYVTNKI